MVICELYSDGSNNNFNYLMIQTRALHKDPSGKNVIRHPGKELWQLSRRK